MEAAAEEKKRQKQEEERETAAGRGCRCSRGWNANFNNLASVG